MKVKYAIDKEIESVIALILNSYKHKHIDMKKFQTQFIAASMLLATTAVAAQTTIEESDVKYSLIPDDYASATSTLMFGYGMELSNDTLLVSACDAGGRYINVYQLNSDLSVAPTLIQQISNTSDNFFGYSISKDGDYLAVTASSAKKFYLYKKNSSQLYELFYTGDATEFIESATSPQIAIHGQNIILTSQSAGVAILKIDEENSTVTSKYKTTTAYATVGISAIEDNVAAFVVSSSSSSTYLLVVIEYDETSGEYTEQTIEFTDGISNHSGVDIENGVIALANVTTSQLYLIEKNAEGTWEITHTADAPATDNSAQFGYNVDMKDGKILVTSNNSSSYNGSSYVYYLNDDALTIACEIKSTADGLNMGSGAAFNGSICAISNSNYKPSDASYGVGVVYLFDLTDALAGINTSIAKIALQQSITDGKTYDLNGREVLNPTHGLYIRNGKLLLLK